MLAAGVNPLEIPAEIRGVEQVPKLGSGNTDFAVAKRMASGGLDVLSCR